MNTKNKIVAISTILVTILVSVFLINKLSNKGTYSASSTPSISLSCTPNKVVALGEVNCNVVLNTNGHTILGLSANYITNNQISYVSYSDYCTNSDCFQTIASTTNGFAAGNINGVSSNSVIIGKIKVNMTNNATPGNSYSIGINNIELSDDEFNLILISGNVTTSVSVKSDDATLKSLTVSTGTLSPSFASSTTSYTVSVPYSTSSITVTGTANKSTANVTGNVTNKALSVGENTINVVVTAEDGTTKKTYTVKVTRQQDNVATLSALSLTDCTLSPAFTSGTTTYSCTVKYNVTSTTITTTANSDGATISGTGTKNLNVGANTLKVVVTAQDGTTKKTYTINVTVDTKYVVIKYHTNGGVLAEEHDSRISLSNNYVMLNNEYLVTSIAYGNSLGTTGLINYNNSTYLNIEKSGYAAKSNAEWNTEPNGTGTSYSQGRAYSSDDFCDASNGICEVTLYVNWVPNNIESILNIDNNIASKITAGTNLSSIIDQVQTNEEIVLYDKSGNVKDNSQILKTGDYITVTSNGTSASYYISVLGDVNGDGIISVIDVAKLFQHYRKTNIIPANEYYYITAGDTVTDDEIKLTDVAKLFQYVRGKISSLY